MIYINRILCCLNCGSDSELVEVSHSEDKEQVNIFCKSCFKFEEIEEEARDRKKIDDEYAELHPEPKWPSRDRWGERIE